MQLGFIAGNAQINEPTQKWADSVFSSLTPKYPGGQHLLHNYHGVKNDTFQGLLIQVRIGY